jgi:hypothetical protein
MHEDGDDEPRLQQGERGHQKMFEEVLNPEVVDEIRHRAEDKQQSPNREIYADRMLLLCVFHGFPLPKIEEWKDEDPHQIDEMPI